MACERLRTFMGRLAKRTLTCALPADHVNLIDHARII